MHKKQGEMIGNAWDRSKIPNSEESWSDSEREINNQVDNLVTDRGERTLNNICYDVINRLNTSNNRRARRVGREMFQYLVTGKVENREKMEIRILRFLKEIQNGPNNVFSRHTPLQISTERYRELIELRKRGSLREGSDEWNQLEDALFAKVCHCVQKQLRRDLTQLLMSNTLKEKDVNNYYAICTDSIYNKRGFKIPPPGIRQCRKRFNWYKDYPNHKE